MPEQQSADLQILGQLQSQYQLEGDSLRQAEQQKFSLQSAMSQSAPIVDLDDGKPKVPKADPITEAKQAPSTPLSRDKAKLAELLTRYTPDHPDVKKLQKQIEKEEKEAALAAAAAKSAVVEVASVPEQAAAKPVPINHVNPVLQSQLSALEAEIPKHREEMQRLTKQIQQYQAKLSAIPVREQEITRMVRDYEISKAHYSQLLSQQFSAETATQLEITQKGEKFKVLDYGQAAERPTSPKRALINGVGSAAGLILGILLAVGTEFLGISITSPEDIFAAVGLPVLEVIPIILTREDRRRRMRRMLVASASLVVAVLAAGVIFFYRSQT
jgi:uncharacterized protein involved in exopolysaccharide biosynthesis